MLEIRIDGETAAGFNRCLADGQNKFSEAVSIDKEKITIFLANLPTECTTLVIRTSD